MALISCPACERHVRAHEPRCPFCAHALAPERAAAIASGGRRVSPGLGRAATFVFGAALGGAALVGCGSSHGPDPDAGGEVDSGITIDAGMAVDSGTLPDAGIDSGTIAPPYGAPADAGPEEDAGLAPLYGGPPDP